MHLQQYFLFPATMAALQEIMTDLKKLFDKFAAEEGSKDTLSKKQLNALLAKEDFGKVSKKYVVPLFHRAVSVSDVLLFP